MSTSPPDFKLAAMLSAIADAEQVNRELLERQRLYNAAWIGTHSQPATGYAIDPNRHRHLAGILAEPGCNVRRLVYADWLDEFGRGDLDAATAEFIRVSCERDADKAGRMPRLAYTWLKANWHRLIPSLRPHFLSSRLQGRTLHARVQISVLAPQTDGNPAFRQPVVLEFWRGFLARLTLLGVGGFCPVLAEHAQGLLRDQPLLTVGFEDWSGRLIRRAPTVDWFHPEWLLSRGRLSSTAWDRACQQASGVVGYLRPQHFSNAATWPPVVDAIAFPDTTPGTIPERRARALVRIALTLEARSFAGFAAAFDCFLPGPTDDQACPIKLPRTLYPQ
jgi:uncharacterized protein (TIGR02996 family)